MTSLLSKLTEALGAKEGSTLTIKMESIGGGDNPEVRVLVTPQLKPVGKNVSDAAIAYRSALRTPFVLTGTAEDIEDDFNQHLQNYVRNKTDTEESLERMEKANAQAAASEAKGDASKAKAAPKAADTKSAPDTNTQPASDDEQEPEAKLGDMNSF